MAEHGPPVGEAERVDMWLGKGRPDSFGLVPPKGPIYSAHQEADPSDKIHALFKWVGALFRRR